MRHVVLLGTGGTIATRSHPGGRRADAGAAELLGSLAPFPDGPRSGADGAGGPADHRGHGFPGGVRVEPRDAARRGGFAAGVGDVLALAELVRGAAAEADGVVVTHGTDTLEESAFLVALAHTGPVPVVFTGAQHPFDDPSPDGRRNLAAAVRWAASEEARGTGVTVVFADRVLPAVGLRKTQSLGVEAFTAPGRGPIGHVDDAGVRRHGTAPHPVLLPPGVSELPRVDVVSQYLGADASAFENAVAAGAKGLVVAAFGAGNTTPASTRACLGLLAEGFPVAVASRTGAGAVAGLYAGGGADLAAAGAIFAGDLSPWQTRLLLAAVLAVEPDPGQVAERCLRWLREAGAVSRGTPPPPARARAGGPAPADGSAPADRPGPPAGRGETEMQTHTDADPGTE